jgi:hypothetical protein
MGNLEAHRDAGPLLRLDLLPQHAVEEVEIRGLGAHRVIKDRIQAVRHVAEPKPRQLLDHARMHDGTHRAPPATIAAYSVVPPQERE